MLCAFATEASMYVRTYVQTWICLVASVCITGAVHIVECFEHAPGRSLSWDMGQSHELKWLAVGMCLSLFCTCRP